MAHLCYHILSKSSFLWLKLAKGRRGSTVRHDAIDHCASLIRLKNHLHRFVTLVGAFVWSVDRNAGSNSKRHGLSRPLWVCYYIAYAIAYPLKEVTDSLVAVLRIPKHEQRAAMPSLTQTVFSVSQCRRPSLPTSRAGTVVLSQLRDIRICAAAAASVAAAS